MKRKKERDAPLKIRYEKCEMCRCLTDTALLYSVCHKKICEYCGQQEIARWNADVKELNGSNHE